MKMLKRVLKVDYRCDFSVVAARIPGGIYRLLAID